MARGSATPELSDERIVLVTGLPRAGKSSFADFAERTDPRFCHVPLDKYLLPVPEGTEFLAWVREPSCVDWALLSIHLTLLASGMPCFTPQPDWSRRGQRLSAGGVEAAAGRRMTPGHERYLLVGTHAFARPGSSGVMARVFMESPPAVIAARLAGHPVPAGEVERVMRQHLGDNHEVVLRYRARAGLLLSGTVPHQAQLAQVLDFLALGPLRSEQ